METDTSIEITRDTLWYPMRGEPVRIKDMHDKHLLATIRVLRGMSPIGTRFRTPDFRRRQWVNAMANEAYQRGLTLDELTSTEPVHE